MIDSFLFLLFSFFYPKRKDFIRMGLGIKARYERNKDFWDKHFTLTKKFIVSNVPQHASSFLILGSGRLYDFPAEEIPACSEITLVDADPLSLFISKWKLLNISKKYKKDFTVRTVLQDVTGAIDYYTMHHELPPDPCPIANCKRHDVVLSLNLLGQLPLYFFTRAEEFQDNPTDNELLELSYELQKQHIDRVIELARVTSIFFFDREFYFYTGDESEWDISLATIEELLEPLESKLKDSSTWLWHISPEETEGEGVIHRIGARAYQS